MKYSEYKHLLFERKEDGIMLITLNRPEVYNAANERMHFELSRVWLDIHDDPQTRVVVVTGAGKAFGAGADLEWVGRMAASQDTIAHTLREVGDIVYNMVNLDKPVISAINGVAVGAALVVGILADISIIAESVRITDGHTRIGLGAGDHAVIIWPLLCGMAKAKYYLLTSDFIDGKEAERIGLVSMSVPADQLMDRAMQVARTLTKLPQHAVRWTKRALNNWLRSAGPSYDTSLLFEMLTLFGDDVKEGIKAFREKRPPVFPSTRS